MPTFRSPDDSFARHPEALQRSDPFNGSDIAWVLASTALVWLMTPGMGFFYSGLLRRKNALSMIWLSFVSTAIVSFQWFFWGYSLVFSERVVGKFIGNLDHFGLKDLWGIPSVTSTRIPATVHCVYQLMFAIITSMIAVGAIAERSRLGPIMFFLFCWTTLVYDFIACWTWNPDGWVSKSGGLDFAGGTPVHISSGTAALAISMHLGPRLNYREPPLAYRPHNATYVALGTAFLWLGWFGFNGGSTLAATERAANACFVTNLSASVGGFTWMLMDCFLGNGGWSAVGFCSGAIAALVAITPGAGYVGAPAAVLYGFLSGVVCNFATQLKYRLEIDDAMDIFATHAIGGVLGNLLTGLFAQASIPARDGIFIRGGWLDHHYIQLLHQFVDSVSGLAWSFILTRVILWIMDLIPGLSLRTTQEAERMGMDGAEMQEYAYVLELEPHVGGGNAGVPNNIAGQENGESSS
ncbi:ammonium transporter [Cantharellus anzutake]|uniref:ammonium transporter n=1 Tax=Cantharellus anzutake TaxID=1750568 RepID=UPI001904446B|nr:ammonium transporter [Cantharellus anzutake]KAF8331655.1 ammonium transporter [Cantharellus anzutake]